MLMIVFMMIDDLGTALIDPETTEEMRIVAENFKNQLTNIYNSLPDESLIATLLDPR